MEVIVLVATFELVQECSAIVWGASNFANYMYNQVSEKIASSESSLRTFQFS